MRPILTIIFILKLALVSGQNFLYPTIKNEGETISDFIPTGWTILDSVSGDLNNDQSKDLAFVIQHKDSVINFKKKDNFVDTLISQPRILVILFHDNSLGNYKLIEQSNTFILNHDNPTMEDAFQTLKIEDEVLQIDFQLFYNIGSWYVTNTSYKFRYKDKKFVLVWADNSSFHRATHEFEISSYDFWTKKCRVYKGNDQVKTEIESHTFKLKEFKTFKTFIQPYTWEITKDTYL
jgi:hypothetical protein